MPLDLLPNLLDDATHLKLDHSVDEYLSRSGLSNLQSEHIPNLTFILLKIIAQDENLDKKFLLELDEVSKLLCNNQDLRDMLCSACARKSYRNIRNLAILRAPGKKTTGGKIRRLTLYRFSKSFRAKYLGAAVHGFYEYLTHNDELFNNPGHPRYYGKFCSIVQSSGTGKSRMLTELSEIGVVVIYMNLRDRGNESGFPQRDPIPSEILTTFPSTRAEYEFVCYAFFTALFQTIEENLASPRKNVLNWVRGMCKMHERGMPESHARTEFFKKVYKKYQRITMTAMDTPSDKATAALGRPPAKCCRIDPKPSDGDDDDDDDDGHHPIPDLLNAYRKMAVSLEEIFSDPELTISGDQSEGQVRRHRPKLVIALDAAQTLTQEGGQKYRPANEVCQVINRYSHDKDHAVWVVFALMTSKVSDFLPPDKQYDSAHVTDKDQMLFSPYTQVGWDQCAPSPEDINIEDVAQLSHILHYGRPLWKSLRTGLGDPVLMLNTAQSKLCGADDFKPTNTNHVLAVLGQRFLVDVTFGHPDSVAHLETGVASHLRICLATTPDQCWRYTSYPSEPLLSCMAAIQLHDKPEHLGSTLGTLLKMVNSGMIDVGQHGELASRLLWLLAKDLYLRQKNQEKQAASPEWNDELLDCQMVPIVDWFEFVFGKHVWDKGGSQSSLRREAFKDAYLNFSHWIRMETFVQSGKEDKNEMSLDEWTRHHWQRTSAVQCSHPQPLIDKVIPIYFKGGPATEPAESRMSQILISDKARESRKNQGDLYNIRREDKNIGGTSPSNSLPYIAILADLSQPSELRVTLSEQDVDDCCLRIYAGGSNKETYPFLNKYPDLEKALHVLMDPQQIPGTGMSCVDYLHAQDKFGSTPFSEHMLSENGGKVPKTFASLAWVPNGATGRKRKRR